MTPRLPAHAALPARLAQHPVPLLALSLLALSLVTLGPRVASAQSAEPVWGYQVKPGDRLVDIAKTYQKNGGDWQKLQQSNAVPDPKKLQPGKQINIPVPALKQGDPIAEAALVHGDVQRLDASGHAASAIKSGDVLTMGEAVQTGERSTLTIRFADGSRMLVTEKSQITLSNLRNYGKTGMADTQVTVQHGGTDSQVAPQRGPVAHYEINTPALNLAVRGTEFRVLVDPAAGGTRTEVLEGKVAGQSDGGQALIGSGYGLVAVPGEPLAQPTALPPTPRWQPAASVLEKLPVRFAWDALAEIQSYRLQLLARVRGNEALVLDQLVSDRSVQWDDLPDGDYVLRVRAVGATGLEGANAVQAFRLHVHPEPPVLSLPSDQQVAQSDRTVFRWESAPEAYDYVFELAQDPGFRDVVAKVPHITQASRSVLLALPAGNYFWRVASVTQDGEAGPYSEVFALVQAQPGAAGK